MNYSMIFYILSSVLTFEGIFLILPCIVGALYGEKESLVYLAVALGSIILGILGRRIKTENKVFYSKEGFVTVSLSWILISLVGALPFVLTGEIPNYLDAVFETVSGFTTTGASIMNDVEILSKTSAFWRLFTHWIGGMGVLVLILAILPISGSYNMHLMRAESPGPSVGKLVPKVRNTAKMLYSLYIVITLIEIAALIVCGMPLFESVTLSFATAGTGGFALLNSSIGSYSVSSQVIITIFMLLFSVNFNVYYLVYTRKYKDAFKNEEMRTFFAIVLAVTLLITANIFLTGMYDNVIQAFQQAAFQVASIISTTGFATTDFNLWPEFSKTLLFFVMFVGACAGSTGGGIKVSRILIYLKSIKKEIAIAAHPQLTKKIKMNGR
ncbi:MAG: TrkH family potassium uptake protein, partial [Firmicutes bacterium]|nr:TrkH family potassium uptake protein [Bacillota bacterium]